MNIINDPTLLTTEPADRPRHQRAICSSVRSGQDVAPAHLPPDFNYAETSVCHSCGDDGGGRVQHCADPGLDLPMQSHRPSMGCDHCDRILCQSTRRLCRHGLCQYCDRFCNFDPSGSHRHRPEIAVAAENWVGLDVCRGISVRCRRGGTDMAGPWLIRVS